MRQPRRRRPPKWLKAVGIKDAAVSVATRASDHPVTARTMIESTKRSEYPGHEFEHMNDEGHEYSKYESGVRLPGERRQEEFKKGLGIVMRPAISTQLWRDRLQKGDFDPFDAGLGKVEWKLPAVRWVEE